MLEGVRNFYGFGNNKFAHGISRKRARSSNILTEEGGRDLDYGRYGEGDCGGTGWISFDLASECLGEGRGRVCTLRAEVAVCVFHVLESELSDLENIVRSLFCR